MIYGIYFRFYKWMHLRILSVLLSYIARFLFILKFLFARITIKHERVALDLESALDILRRTSPEPVSCPDYSMEDMKADIDLSIIVPVYNHIDVIERCIDSLLRQKTLFQYELILVDDGSTDGAQLVIEKYAAYENVIIIHQENGGIGAARNTGLCRAHGRYIMFVDCDDYVHDEIVEKLMQMAVHNDADIVMCAHNLVKVKDGVVISVLPNIYPQLNLLGYRNGDVIMNYAGLPWGKVYKRELFEKVRYFPGYWYEDNIIHSLVFTQCRSFFYVPEVLYEYQWHESNFSHIQGGKKQNKGIDSYWLLKAIVERYEELGFKQDPAFYTMLLRHVSAYYYSTVSTLENDVIQAMFIAGRELLLKYKPAQKVRLPYMLRVTEKAMIEKDIALWKLCSVNQ